MLGWSRGLVPGADADAARHTRLRTRRAAQTTPRMTVDGRRIAVLGAGKIGEGPDPGLLSGWRTTEDIVASGRRE